jgi:hypothetical protein
MKLTISRLAAAATMLALASGAMAAGASEQQQAANTVSNAEAIASFDATTEKLWAALPLSFRHVLFTSDVNAYGSYTPRADGVFQPGETATIYVEPVGYGYATGADGETVSLSTAVEIRTPGGLILGSTDDFGKLVWTGKARSREVHGAISFDLPDLKPGTYELLLRITDEATGKDATAVLPFTVGEKPEEN